MHRIYTVSARSQKVWTLVMREGRSVGEVAAMFSLPTTRVERLLLAIGRRRAMRFM